MTDFFDLERFFTGERFRKGGNRWAFIIQCHECAYSSQLSGDGSVNVVDDIKWTLRDQGWRKVARHGLICPSCAREAGLLSWEWLREKNMI